MSRLPPLQRAGLTACFLALATLYLWRSDFLSRIETDVSSILPQGDTIEARLARDIINRQQARAAYLIVELPPEAAPDEVARWLERRFADAPEIARATPLSGEIPLVSTSWSEADRMALIFPKWLARNRVAHGQRADAPSAFPEWAAQEAVARLDAFLQSPESLELADGPLFDPLLLVIDALERLAPIQPADDVESPQILPYWLALSGSGLNQDFQYAYLNRIKELQSALAAEWPGATLEAGGLVSLAAASRERIQKDVYTINLISLVGVVVVSLAMLRRVTPLLAAAPTILSATLGGAAITGLFFDRISIIVIVVGSILIGTAIDYAMHMLLRQDARSGVNSRKLLLLACLSTVAGFCALLFSSMELVRQIGAFVAGGLASAYLAASLLSPIQQREIPDKPAGARRRWPFWCGAALAAGIIAFGLPRLRWEDDIAKLEAAAPEIVARDVALRERLGNPAAATTIVSTGPTFLDAMERQSRLLESAGDSSAALALSALVTTRAEAEAAENSREEIRAFFATFERALDESGYDAAAFGAFFAAARQTFAEGAAPLTEIAEAKLDEIAQSLVGPAAFLLGSEEGFRWTTLSTPQPPDDFLEALRASPDSVSLSSKTFLSGYLGQARREMAAWGGMALAVVVVLILVGSGARLGLAAVAIPVGAVVCALSIASLAWGALDLFFLIGTFLGLALALDYALFGVAYFRAGLPIPKSVWLSYGTTAAAFFALTQSAVPMVRSLGLSVLLITSLTVLALVLAGPILRPRNE